MAKRPRITSTTAGADIAGKRRLEAYWRAIHTAADERAPQLAERFTHAVARSSRHRPAGLLEALDSGNVDRATRIALGAWRDAAKPMQSSFGRLLSRTAYESATSDAQNLGIAFRVTNPQARRWADEHAAKLVTRMTADQQRVIRDIITDGFENQLTRGVVSRRIVATGLGLNRQQARSLAHYREQLASLGTEPRLLVKRVQRYRDRLVRQRSATIARTELMRASNMGQQLLWDNAVKAGRLDPSRVRKRWILTPDDRLCPFCREMANVTAALQGDFSHPKFGQVPTPPLHPQCRCAVGLERVGSVPRQKLPRRPPRPRTAARKPPAKPGLKGKPKTTRDLEFAYRDALRAARLAPSGYDQALHDAYLAARTAYQRAMADLTPTLTPTSTRGREKVARSREIATEYKRLIKGRTDAVDAAVAEAQKSGGDVVKAFGKATEKVDNDLRRLRLELVNLTQRRTPNKALMNRIDLPNPEGTPSEKRSRELGVEAFSRMVDPTLDHRGKVTRATSGSGDRAWALRDTFTPDSSVYLTRGEPSRTVVHELGHTIENQSDALFADTVGFLDKRTKGKASRWLGEGYRKDEIYRPGGFERNYTSKIYTTERAASPHRFRELSDGTKISATEVVSMGVEAMHADPTRLLLNDPEYFEFVLSRVIWRSDKGGE